MSRPPTFTAPAWTRAYRLRTARGEFAVVDAPARTGDEGHRNPAEPASTADRGEPERRAKGTVLLLPGFTGSKEDFVALHAPLADAGYRTVAVDGRGQYESRGPVEDEAPYAQEELAKDVLAQAAALGTRVHLLGHSFGGLVARAAVLRDPGPFVSLTLMSSGPAAISASQVARMRTLHGALTALDLATVWELMREQDPPEQTATDVRADASEDLRRRWLANSPAHLLATGRQLCEEPDRVDELSALRLPVHVVSGERDDTWPVPLQKDMARRLSAPHTIVVGAEHSPNTDRPAETAAALAGFWDRLS